ncbi:MAG: tRNA pseudouridine(55) synthase TruB [Clostridia bacterium]|nr:tRNA pseudouridine(55) synthase TruB [Clostridia bacterium]
MQNNNYNGIIIINKPENFTSFDVVAVMRGILKQKKIGHTGTLDPMATGVLPVMLGKATKTLSILEDTDKEYIAQFKLGLETDTQDITGKILNTADVCVRSRDIENALENFKGEIFQIPPMYSAVKVNGKRLHELARQSIEVKRKPRKIYISNIKLIEFNSDTSVGSLLISCSKGTYIRTICHDMGRLLGSYAVLTNLKRTKACSFTLNDCITLEQLKSLADNNKINQYILGIDTPFHSYNPVSLVLKDAVKFQNGVKLPLDSININTYRDNELFRVYYQDNFLGLGQVFLNDGIFKIFKNLSVIKL